VFENEIEELVLHVGPHKTGSKAIQKALRSHQEFLITAWALLLLRCSGIVPAVHKAFIKQHLFWALVQLNR